MDEATTMTVPPPLPAKSQTTRESGPQESARRTVSIRAVSPPSPRPSEAGATVFVGGTAPADPATTWRIPEVQSSNARESGQSVGGGQAAAHVVKIKINPDENGKVISTSTVRLTPDEKGFERNGDSGADGAVVQVQVYDRGSGRREPRRGGTVVVSGAGVPVNDVRGGENSASTDCASAGGAGVGDGCVRISVGSNEVDQHRAEMVLQRGSADALNRSNACFYYGSFQNPLVAGMVMSSGQCSPSDTLDSGTCSDLDGTPPPQPKKKNSSSTVILGAAAAQHNRTGSLTSSGAEVDSDDNESNISCDSLNSGDLANGIVVVGPAESDRGDRTPHDDKSARSEHRESKDDPLRDDRSSGAVVAPTSELRSTRGSPSVSPSPSGASSLSKASTTPRVRSPDLLLESKRLSPIVKECTYEERKREQEKREEESRAADFYANYNRANGTKYVYDDDRFYKFHLNELNRDGDEEKSRRDSDTESFAGYPILDREAIRSAKGTVRGVKNRVRAGIATFLQKPSSKNYKERDAGKVVVYTTTSGIVRKTYYDCMKVKQILRTHLVKYDERDMFMSTECQAELRDRIGCTVIQVPHLFIDGQYIGDAEVVERLNESGELRRMLEPYKDQFACNTCLFCGNYKLLPCPVCNGSKKSVHRNGFTAEFVALRCMNCDEVGLVPCKHC